jgi:hypothetical protein
LLIKLSKDNPNMINRVIAVAKHEWWLKFGIKNEDPNKASWQINIWTFQLSAQKSDIVNKYNNSLESGKDLLKANSINFDDNKFKKLQKYEDEIWSDNKEKAQCDLLSWLGYINKERWWQKIFDKLSDPNLTDNELKKLISDDIQWWVAKIGEDVVNQTKYAKVDDYTMIG